MEQQKVAARRRPGDQRRGANAVLQAANSYIVRYYPFGCLGKDPQRLVDLWIVQVFLTSPGVGAVGEVGLVAVDARTVEVVGATERREVNRAIKQLREAKRDELQAAFHRSRTS